jgi:hypothetical protein
MKSLLPGITLKTILCCALVSAFISYGSCAFYLTLKSSAAKLTHQEKTQQYEQSRMNADGLIAIK